jgi:Phosphotransferase enzyme family
MFAGTQNETCQAIERFISPEPPFVLQKGRAVTPLRENRVLISFYSSRKLRHQLACNGFTHIHEFSMLPTCTQPRWLLPTNSALMLSGLQMYAPFSVRAQFLKLLLSSFIRLGWKGWNRAKMIVASRQPLPLQVLAMEVTGEKSPVFALSLGSRESFRALTLQVMRPSGKILGYIKLGLTREASNRVRHEADVLHRLWEKSPALHQHIPRVLHSGEFGDNYILFQSSGPPASGPRRFCKMHVDFLRLLEEADPVEKPGLALVEEVGSSWQRAELRLDAEWRRLGESALREARRLLREGSLPCGVVHGDFAPWNTRQQSGQLFVFDWESAKWQAPNKWDVFRFHERVSILLNEKQARFPRDLTSPADDASFLLYSLRSVCEALDEGGRRIADYSDYQKRQVLACLRQSAGQVEARHSRSA